MGFNSVLLVLNDDLSGIEKDPEFGQRVADAIRAWFGRKDVLQVGVAGHATTVKVVGQDHADTLQVLALGGNMSQVVGFSRHDRSIHGILVDIADQHGYRLVRKSVRQRGRADCEECRAERDRTP